MLIDIPRVTEADLWNQRLLPLKRLILPQSAVVTKVAVLDTGLHFDADIADLYDDRAEAYCFLENDVTPSEAGTDSPAPLRFDGDEDGHGTHMCSIVLDVGTNCKVYSGRIARKREDIRGKKSRQDIAARIARVSLHNPISDHHFVSYTDVHRRLNTQLTYGKSTSSPCHLDL
jgi:hypothetical protein